MPWSRVIAVYAALVMFYLWSSLPAAAQQLTTASVAVSAVSHVKEALHGRTAPEASVWPDGPVAIDVLATSPVVRDLATVAAESLSAPVVESSRLLDCRVPRLDCQYVGVSGIISINRVAVTADSAEVVVFVRTHYRRVGLRTYKLLSYGLLLQLERDGDSWQVTGEKLLGVS